MIHTLHGWRASLSRRWRPVVFGFLRLHWLIAVPLFVLHLPICVLILPFRRVRFGIFSMCHRIGHLALNTDLLFRRRWLARGPDRADRDLLVFFSGDPANEQLLKMWARKALVVRDRFLHSVMCLTEPLWAK